jgi:D-amino-acid dehydrogenase
MKIVVIGGGITGLFVSYRLLKHGHQVTIVEKYITEDGAAAYSAGLITPSTGVAPAIGMGEILSTFFGRKSAISISLFEILRNLRWFRIAARQGLTGYEDVIGAFGKRSLQLYQEFFRDENFNVTLLEGIAGLYEDRGQAATLASTTGARLMEETELLEMGFTGVGGGVFAKDELSVDPLALLVGLKRRVTEMGATMLQGDPRLKAGPGDTASVSLNGEQLPADHCVVTAGARSREICRSLGHDPLVLPARGFSMLFETDEKVIGCPAFLEDTGIAAIQHNDRVFRLTSFFEMVGFNREFPQKRQRWMLAQAASHFSRFGKLRPTGGGVGFRPCTPDQLPIVGRVPGFENLYLATGSCRLGVTLAPATAELTEAEIEGTGQSSQEFLTRFGPGRFSRPS